MAGIIFDKSGETPLDDISGLIPRIATRKELDNAESINIANAYLELTVMNDPSMMKFDEPFLREIHRLMLGDVWTWAGTYRTTQTSVGIEANMIQQKIYQLTDDLEFWSTHWDYRETATHLHHMLVKIHPFPNGNGRWGRLVTELWLMSKGHEEPSWIQNNDLTEVNSYRDAYIQALKAADKGDYTQLKRFMFPES